MPSPGSATANLCVDDVLAFDDAELFQYMKQNHHPDGGFDLEFDGWETLPKDQRDRLAEKLRWFSTLVSMLPIADIRLGSERRK